MLIAFVACGSIRGEDLSRSILQVLHGVGLDVTNCHAQGYDGASNMSGEQRGCQAFIKKSAPLATYYYCGSHQLNLALLKSATVPQVHAMVCSRDFFKIFPKAAAPVGVDCHDTRPKENRFLSRSLSCFTTRAGLKDIRHLTTL